MYTVTSDNSGIVPTGPYRRREDLEPNNGSPPSYNGVEEKNTGGPVWMGPNDNKGYVGDDLNGDPYKGQEDEIAKPPEKLTCKKVTCNFKFHFNFPCLKLTIMIASSIYYVIHTCHIRFRFKPSWQNFRHIELITFPNCPKSSFVNLINIHVL